MAELTCCSPATQESCCESSDKDACCGPAAAGGSCGCSAGHNEPEADDREPEPGAAR
jgi:hypothetical protein